MCIRYKHLEELLTAILSSGELCNMSATKSVTIVCAHVVDVEAHLTANSWTLYTLSKISNDRSPRVVSWIWIHIQIRTHRLLLSSPREIRQKDFLLPGNSCLVSDRGCVLISRMLLHRWLTKPKKSFDDFCLLCFYTPLLHILYLSFLDVSFW